MKAQLLRVALLLSFMAGACSAVAADSVARLLFSQGLVTVQSAHGEMRIVAKGSVLAEGDAISTDSKGFAVIEYMDGAKTTLRPASSLRINHYSPASVSHTLLQGGLRSVTGAIGKANPERVKYQTATATLGIRGTAFDARLCRGADDCAAPSADVIARVIFSRGMAMVGERVLANGSGIAAGDTINTETGAVVVLAFSDGSKVSIAPKSSFSVKEWLYKKGQAGQALLQLVKGAARVATGGIGKQNPSAYKVQVATAVVGIRGTGFDLDCHDQCAATSVLSDDLAEQDSSIAATPPKQGERLFAYVWHGAIEVSAGKYQQLVRTGQVLAMQAGTGASQYLASVPSFMADTDVPRPDQVPGSFDDTEDVLLPGLYSWVRSGEVELAQGGGAVRILPGESAYAPLDGGVPVKLHKVPATLADDPFPYPETFDELATLMKMRVQLRSQFVTTPAQCTIR
ncbi:FecR domain-containing protein [Vogesella sp. LYT5W]|uniref:FecR domain-containing protein n=1 Tax=Vogesella margarita TaxID=2984199 RepID=A0ABT5IM50_9NEIS|nr:FecR domain-containing protein [Vogesella margarita]MDC7713641.1 FecR domain-containing protein [Vogesella margarita]